MGYPQSGSLVFRSINPDRHKWLLLTFQKDGPEYHPQRYRIDTIVPSRNHGSIGGYRSKHDVQWDDFELWIKNYILKSHKLRIVQDEKERQLTLWEAFVFCNDSYFSEWGFSDKKKLFKTLDLNATVDARYEHYNDAIKTLYAHNQRTHRQFEHSAIAYLKDGWINNG